MNSCPKCHGFRVWPPFSPDARPCPYCPPAEAPEQPDETELARLADDGNPHCPDDAGG